MTRAEQQTYILVLYMHFALVQQITAKIHTYFFFAGNTYIHTYIHTFDYADELLMMASARRNRSAARKKATKY